MSADNGASSGGFSPGGLPPDAPPDAEKEGVQLCCFTVGPDQYVIDIRRVDEILQPMQVTPLPRSPPFVEGVVTLRGTVMPVVDVRRRLGVSPEKPKHKWRMLVVWIGRKRVGLLVDSVQEVVRVQLSDLKPAPPLLGEGAPFVLGVCSASSAAGSTGQRSALRLLLDVKALVAVDAGGARG